MSRPKNETPRQKYQRYCENQRAKQATPMPFKSWLQFFNWGAVGGKQSNNDKVAAGKAGAAALRKKLAAQSV